GVVSQVFADRVPPLGVGADRAGNHVRTLGRRGGVGVAGLAVAHDAVQRDRGVGAPGPVDRVDVGEGLAEVAGGDAVEVLAVHLEGPVVGQVVGHAPVRQFVGGQVEVVGAERDGVGRLVFGREGHAPAV